MRNYFKVSFRTTAAIIALFIVVKTAFTMYNPIYISGPVAFIGLSGVFLFYCLIDFFIVSNHAEVDGKYVHIPILVASAAVSFCGVIVSYQTFQDGIYETIANFVIFLVSGFFLARTIIVTIINNIGRQTFSPLYNSHEVTKLFWNFVKQMTITIVILLFLNHLL